MPPSKLTISKIGPESAAALQSLFDHYLRDMAEWFEIDTIDGGSHFRDASLVWEKGYDTYLAKAGDSIAGFALVGSADAWLDEKGGHDVDEFFVLREFRRNGVGQKLAAHVWNERPGPWLVRVLEANAPALAFWRATVSSYSPGLCREEERIVHGRPWRFLRFISRLTPAPPDRCT